MNSPSDASTPLTAKHCVPCEGGVPKLTLPEAEALRQQTPQWRIVHEGERIQRQWRAKNFMTAITFFNQVAALAEAEGHHPDLHLEGYRNITVEIWTHAIGGLSENDFILAARIDQIPIAVRTTA